MEQRLGVVTAAVVALAAADAAEVVVGTMDAAVVVEKRILS